MSQIHLSERHRRAIARILSDDLSDPIELVEAAELDVKTFFEDATFSDLDFRKSDLTGVSFRGARLFRLKLYSDQAQAIKRTKPALVSDWNIRKRPRRDHDRGADLAAFGQLVRRLRASKGVTQEWLASEALGNPDRRCFVSEIEK